MRNLKKECVDINECIPDEDDMFLHNCDTFGQCSNTFGSFECSCIDGYYGNGYDCHPECPECGPNTFCDLIEHNVTSTTLCQCLPGYDGNPDNLLIGCTDVNECLRNDFT